MFDKGMIVGVCVPIRGKGTTKTCEEKSETCSTSGGCYCEGRTPPAATCRWLAGWAAPLVVREKSTATAVEFI